MKQVKHNIRQGKLASSLVGLGFTMICITIFIGLVGCSRDKPQNDNPEPVVQDLDIQQPLGTQ